MLCIRDCSSIRTVNKPHFPLHLRYVDSVCRINLQESAEKLRAASETWQNHIKSCILRDPDDPYVGLLAHALGSEDEAQRVRKQQGYTLGASQTPGWHKREVNCLMNQAAFLLCYSHVPSSSRILCCLLIPRTVCRSYPRRAVPALPSPGD